MAPHFGVIPNGAAFQAERGISMRAPVLKIVPFLRLITESKDGDVDSDLPTVMPVTDPD